MCDVVDVSWLTAGPAEVEFAWGTVKGTLRRDPRSWDSVPSDQSLVFASSKSDSEWLTVRYADGRGHPSLVRVVSPAPPVTPAAEEWAEGDVVEATLRIRPDYGRRLYAYSHPFPNHPLRWTPIRGGCSHDCFETNSLTDIVRVPLCPPGLTPVDLDELAEKVEDGMSQSGTPASGAYNNGIAYTCRVIRSYRRSGSAER